MRAMSLTLKTFLAGMLAAAAHGALAALPIEHWTAATGARVFFVPSPSIPMLDINLDVDAGTRYEPAAKVGLASLTAGMLDKGVAAVGSTPARDEAAIADAFADVGASFSGGAGGDRTSLRLRTLSDPAERKPAVDLMAQIVAAPTVPDAVLTRDKQRTVAAIRESLTKPQVLADRAFGTAIYGTHPYGQSATPDTVQSITRDDILRFYHANYTAKRAVVTLIGAISRQEAEAIAEQVTRGLPPDGATPPALPAVDAPLAKADTVRIAHPAQQATIVMGQPGIARSDKDYFPLLVGNYVLGGGGFQLAPDQRSPREARPDLQHRQLFRAGRAAWPVRAGAADAQGPDRAGADRGARHRRPLCRRGPDRCRAQGRQGQPRQRFPAAPGQQPQAAGQRRQHRVVQPAARLPGHLDAARRGRHARAGARRVPARAAAADHGDHRGGRSGTALTAGLAPERKKPAASPPVFVCAGSTIAPMASRTPNRPKTSSATSHARAPHQVRIIGGQYKRTPLPVIDAEGLRPTGDRVRETLFNWLGQDLAGWRCADLFAGTGALGFEAASRGAARVTLVESHAPALRALHAVRDKLRAGMVDIVAGDVFAWLARQADGAFDLVFIDPPFAQDWTLRALEAALRVVPEGGLIYVESPRPLVAVEPGDGVAPEAGTPLPAGVVLHRHLRAGAVHAHLLLRKNG